MVIYFSATGNSKYVAEALADRLSMEAVDATDYIRAGKTGDFHSKDSFIFVFPVYLSTMAKPFLNFIEASYFFGCEDAYFVATCASAMGSVPNIAKNFCKDKALNFKGAVKVQMPQNYIAFFKMAEEEECHRLQDEALKTCDRIARVIRSAKSLSCKEAGKLEYSSTMLVEKLYNGSFTGSKSFYTTDQCVGCGLCAQICPLGNIRMMDGEPLWIYSCVHCMACINRCPKAAIEYGKFTKGKRRYVCRKYKSEE